MLHMGWYETFMDLAWPGELVDYVDARPPDHGTIEEALTRRCVRDQATFGVYFTTYAGLRDLMCYHPKRGGWVPSEDGLTIIKGARGRKVALVVDEAQGVALPGSGQTEAAHHLGKACSAVAAVTATPIGNPSHLRLWALCRLVRPDMLLRLPNPPEYDPQPELGTFDAFKARYAYLVDQIQRTKPWMKLSVHRAYVADVWHDRIRDEVMPKMAPWTCRRRKEDCLDLPPKVYMVRSAEMDEYTRSCMVGLAEYDRAILQDGYAVVPANVLEERLRVLELAGGWLEGRPVHSTKLQLLADVLEELNEELGERAPKLVWASRSRPLIASALVLAGAKPDEALRMTTGASEDGSLYSDIVRRCRAARVGIIHGPTPDRDRDSIQRAWKDGNLDWVVAHPGVAGAGLNWQHVRASVYYDQPLGTIARQQSEDRVHRHGLEHTALYYDLVLEDGPDQAVAAAHRAQRDVEGSLLAWLSSLIR